MKRNITLIALLVAFGAGTASAQSFGYNETNNLFYFAQRTPQVNQMNPAFFPSSNSFYLQLPTVGTQFGFPLSLGDIVYYDEAQDANIININRILDTLTDNSVTVRHRDTMQQERVAIAQLNAYLHERIRPIAVR